MGEKLLEVKHLHTSFFTHLGEVKAIRDVSFHVDKSEIIGIVGESGSGKSVTSLSIMGLLAHPGKVTGGEILFKGEDLLKKKKHEMRKIQGNEISMIFQDPMTSLNPLFTIGNQITEAIRTLQKMSREDANKRAVEMLRMVGIPSPEKRVKSYPHEFSGGMRQRAMIAMALSSEPDLLIADEPTTALDVTIQAQVLSLMKELNERLGTATILITHNLGCASSICDRILVMYGGKIMEEGSTEEIFYEPRHPYTMGLLNSVPKVSGEQSKKRLVPILGTPPDMLHPPTGCPFYPRCRFAMKACASMEVPEFSLSGTHRVSCFMCHPDAPANEVYEKQKGGIRHG